MPYLLDSDVHWTVDANRRQVVFSIEKVGDEIQAGADELAAWAQNRGPGFFLPPEAPILPSLAAVSTWATNQKYAPSAVSTFLQVADYYLVAQALTNKFVVVTHEVPADSVRKIKIPNACIGVGVKFMTPYEMLRKERARFVLPK